MTKDRDSVAPVSTLGLCIVGALYILMGYSVLFLDDKTVQLVAGEEMLLETLGAIWFMVCSALCYLLLRGRQHSEQHRREVWVWGFLALFFFVAAGEELSWGQHMFGFTPPQAVSQLSRQEEFNLHNLWLFDTRNETGERAQGIQRFINSNRLFDYFMLCTFIIAPLGYRMGGRSKAWLERFAIPETTVDFAPLAIANYVLSLILVPWLGQLGSGPLNRFASEIRESNNAFLCLLLCTHSLLLMRRLTSVANAEAKIRLQ